MKDEFIASHCESLENYFGTIRKVKKLLRRCKGKSKRQKTLIAETVVNECIRKVLFSTAVFPVGSDRCCYIADNLVMATKFNGTIETVLLSIIPGANE